MLFSRQKKLQRDRDAGLVFCWRGGQGGNRGGLFISIILALVLFAGAFWGLSLNFKVTQSDSKQTAKILLLDSVSSEMALWIDQNTPFPSRWDPQNDTDHQQRVDRAMRQVFQGMSRPVSPWIEMPEVVKNLDAPRFIEPSAVQLGNLPIASTTAKPQGVFELIIALDAYGDLSQRLPDVVSDVRVKIPMQEYGSDLRFSVTLDSSGSVLYCAPVEWLTSDYAKNIENWVRVQQFKPSSKLEQQVGEVTVRVEVKNHAGN